MCVFVCVCVCVCVCVGVHVYVSMCVYVCARVCVSVCVLTGTVSMATLRTLLRYIGISKICNTCCALARVCDIECAHTGAREAFVCVCVRACV